MGYDTWIQQRRPAWNRLAAVVDQLSRNGPQKTDPRQVSEMAHAYRAVSADLARLRALGADPALVSEVNHLVTRAHGQIYRGTAPRRRFSVLAFLAVDYPRLFRRNWKFTLASFAISALSAVMAYHTVQDSPEIVADILGGADQEFYGEKSLADIRERFGHQANPLLSSLVTTNNIRVAITAFALGITLGIGTIYILFVNGSMVGGISGAFAKSGAASDFWMTILPHGALELSAIVVAGGAGLLMGYSIWCPGLRTRRRALREEAVHAIQLAAGLIPAFIVAGLYEGLLTPTDVIPQPVKVAIGVVTAALFWLHLLIGGRTSSGQSGERSASAP